MILVGDRGVRYVGKMEQKKFLFVNRSTSAGPPQGQTRATHFVIGAIAICRYPRRPRAKPVLSATTTEEYS